LIADYQSGKDMSAVYENTHHKKSRWAELSERIHKNPPLSGAGDYVLEYFQEFREDFAFEHDKE